MKNVTRLIAILLVVLMALALIPMSAWATDGEETGGGEHSHVFDQQLAAETYLAAAATCTAPASYFYSCACGEKGTETFSSGDALEHDFSVEVAGSPATCTEAGHSAYKKCANCEAIEGKETIDALGHDWDDGVINPEPSCTDTGVKTFTCKREDCGETKTETVDALGHSWENGRCTRAGCGEVCTHETWVDGVCRRCALVCPHDNLFDDNGNCPDCGKKIAATLTVTYNEGGVVEVFNKGMIASGADRSVLLNSETPLVIRPNDNCRVKSVSLDGVDQQQRGDTGAVVNFAVTLTADAALNVVFEQGLAASEFDALVPQAPGHTATNEDGSKTYTYDISLARREAGKEMDGVYPLEPVSFLIPYPEGLTATNHNYSLTHKPDGKAVPFQATPAGIQGESASFSDFELTAVPVVVEVAVSGVPVVGATLTATVTPADAEVTYQWQRDGEDISGATKETYDLAATDVNKKITCKVTDQKDEKNTAVSEAVTPTKPVVAVNRIVDDGVTQKGKLGGLCPGLEYGVGSSGPWKQATGTTADVTVAGTYFYRVPAADGKYKVFSIGTIDDYYTVTTKLLYGKGTVNPITRTVKKGTSGGTFTFTPNKNYKIADIRIDGTRVASSKVSTTYTMDDIYSKTLLEYGFTYTGTTPHTGDDSHLGLWAELLALSLLGLGAALTVARRKGRG